MMCSFCAFEAPKVILAEDNYQVRVCLEKKPLTYQ